MLLLSMTLLCMGLWYVYFCLPILTSPAIRFCGKGCRHRSKWINCCRNSWRRYEWCTTWLESLANGYSFSLSVLKLLVCVCSVTEVELQRAKNSTISSVLMNLESRVIMNSWSIFCQVFLNKTCHSLLTLLQVVVAEDIGRQLLSYGCR